ncbi:hypothetical protein ABZ372_26000, partial [Streptomyces sp. NPDC005921]
MRIAILDDYQSVALGLADWDSLDAEVEVFTDPFANEGEVVAALAGYDVVVAMRERTPFPSSTLSALPRLKLLVTTGPVNAAIDLDAARRADVTVCGAGDGRDVLRDLDPGERDGVAGDRGVDGGG